jgi:HEAT repeat protein
MLETHAEAALADPRTLPKIRDLTASPDEPVRRAATEAIAALEAVQSRLAEDQP